MAQKQSYPINKFEGGVNTDTNARDIKEGEFKIGHNVDTSVIGRIKCPGNWEAFYDLATAGDNIFANDYDTVPGYGIFPFTVDKDITASTHSGVEGHYIAIYKPSDGSIAMFVDPVVGGDHCVGPVFDPSVASTDSTGGIDQLGDTNYISTTKVDYLYIDGSLIVFDAGTDTTNWAKPIKWYFWDSGITYFYNTASTTGSGDDGILTVDTISVNSGTAWVDATYDNVTFTATGSNTSAAFRVVISSGVATVYILSSGAGYAVDNTITVNQDQLGDAGGDNLTFNVATIDGTGGDGANVWAAGVQFKSPDNGEYLYDHQFIRQPSGGSVTVGSLGDAFPALTSALTTDYVGLIINSENQTFNNMVGWGKDGGESQNYTFYASYVWQGDQESMAVKLGTADLGGWGTWEEGSGTNEDTQLDNDVTFLVEVPIRDGNNGAILWNPRITSVRIYYRVSDQNKDILYFIGDFPVTSPVDGTGAVDDVCLKSVHASTVGKHVLLKGDKTGKGIGTYAGSGTYHATPPTIFTHGVKSGLSGDTISTECQYKTGVILNRKFYVGNIKQKTSDSPSTPRVYPDRLLKSIANRFDVLPDNEFIDVAIRDGESIVKLAGMGNRLLQFKENTLYVIAVAGGEEYLEAKYQNMGVRHPNAVVTMEEGIFWVNEFGAFIMLQDKPPINIIDGKIDKSEWSNFITANAIVGYFAKEKKLFVIGDSSSVATSSDESNDVDTYCFNIVTGGWNQQVDVIGYGSTHDSVSNIIDYQGVDGNHHMVMLTGSDSGGVVTHLDEYKRINDVSGAIVRPFNFVSKEFSGERPHVRKTIYKVYITYRGEIDNSADVPQVYLNIVNQDQGSVLIKLEAVTDFVSGGGQRGDVGTDSNWSTAVFKPSAADRSKARNVYGAQLVIRGTEITDAIADGENGGTTAITTSGTYVGQSSRVPYKIEITTNATPDTFTWYEGTIDSAGEPVWGNYTETAIDTSTSAYELSHGVNVAFDSTTNGQVGDLYTFDAVVGGNIDQRFEINDISLVFRFKRPK